MSGMVAGAAAGLSGALASVFAKLAVEHGDSNHGNVRKKVSEIMKLRLSLADIVPRAPFGSVGVLGRCFEHDCRSQLLAF